MWEQYGHDGVAVCSAFRTRLSRCLARVLTRAVVQLAMRDRSASERLVNSLNLELRGNHAFGNDVNQRSDRRGHAHAVNRLDVSLR